jgi:hypothetical protein
LRFMPTFFWWTGQFLPGSLALAVVGVGSLKKEGYLRTKTTAPRPTADRQCTSFRFLNSPSKAGNRHIIKASASYILHLRPKTLCR